MRKLYHHWLCPFSRKIRLCLYEKKLDFSLVFEPLWEMRPEFLRLNPENKTPVLIDLNGTTIVSNYGATEYIEETYPELPLFPESPAARAEVRRLLSWFDEKMATEVTLPLVHEKTIKRYMEGSRGPDSAALRNAKQAIHHHLDYMAWLIDRRRWLSGEVFSIVDLTAAAHLSSLDYLGDVPWENHEIVRDWYACLKSRPSFRALLSDRLPGIPPAPHYSQLDF
ncbi:MAG: glutathione S-transferase family protein [Alphaproteobacteria bacterium]|nr:glutathione S-transferase family protein [Alphaproteobacteria bacterium]